MNVSAAYRFAKSPNKKTARRALAAIRAHKKAKRNK